MQIHELTQSTVTEGFLGDLGKGMFQGATGVNLGSNPSAQAATAAKGLTKQGYGPSYQKPSDRWEDKYNQIANNPTIKQYAAGIAQGWLKNSSSLIQSTPAVTPPPAPTQAPVKTTKSKYGKPTPIAVGGAPKPGAPTPAEQEKFQQKLAAAAKKQMNEAASPQYLKAFKQWTAQQLATKVPATGETVTMDKVEKLPGLSGRLSQALAQVGQTQGTPQHTQAIEDYVMLAVAGVQALAQTSKNNYGTVKTNIGISPVDLANLKALARTPAGKDMLKRELGL
jgi:hypothetical protein